jgi:hypothetical protein
VRWLQLKSANDQHVGKLGEQLRQAQKEAEEAAERARLVRLAVLFLWRGPAC